MKKLLVTTLVLGSMAASTAFAAGGPDLSGLSITGTVEASAGGVSATDGTNDTAKSNALGLQARYDWNLAPTFALGLGASYSSSVHKAGTYAGSGAAATLNNRFSIDVIPSIALAPDLQLYGKVSSVYGQAASDDGVNTANAQGVGYGIGIRKMMDQNLYLQIGYDLNKFRDVTFGSGTTASFQENVFSVGVGYKF